MMTRPIVILLVAAACCGCNGRNRPLDPFLTSPTIPPPGTAPVMPPTAGDPYYPPGTAPAAPATVPPAATPYAPPGGSYQYQQPAPPYTVPPGSGLPTSESSPRGEQRPSGSVATSPDVKLAGPSALATARSSSVAAVHQAVHSTSASSPSATAPEHAESDIAPPALRRQSAFEEVLDEQSASAVPSGPAAAEGGIRIADGGSANREPNRLQVPDDAIDIMDLPAATSRTVPAMETTLAGHAAADTVAARDQASYGFDPDHRWLKGKLEYLQSRQQWKLRYIPIDGETDAFGGSVVLDGSDLSGYEPGQFIAVAGSVLPQEGDAAGFAPHYRIEQIKPLH